MGIEPTCPAWKAGALPLSYTRGRLFFFDAVFLWRPFVLIVWSVVFLIAQVEQHRDFSNLPSGGSRIRTCEG